MSRRYYLRSMGTNMRKDVADIRATFPELAGDFQLPNLLPPEVLYFYWASEGIFIFLQLGG